MTITKKPTRPATPVPTKPHAVAESFIHAAEHPVTAEPPAPIEPKAEAEAAPKAKTKDKRKKKEKKVKKNKEAVIIRFEDQQLAQIDARAESLGLARAAWVRMAITQVLSKG